MRKNDCRYQNERSSAFSGHSEIPGLLDKMNAFIKMAKEDGTLTEIENIWFGKDESVKVIPPLDALSAENGTVRVALETTYAPIVYIKDQKIVGYKIDILYRFCEYYHFGLELMDMQFDAVLPAVTSGKCDIGASGLEYNDEHADSVALSDPHLTAHTSLAVQDLTKMSDIIRSRSYEAFLPLIVSTLIYFILARIITWAMDRLLKRISPKRVRRTAGGENA